MSQQQPQENNEILYIIGALVVILIVAKIFLGDYLLAAHLFLRRAWIEGMRLVWDTPYLDAIHTKFRAYATTEWTVPRLSELSRATRWMAFPVLGSILGFYGWRVIGKNPAAKFKRSFNMKSLAQSETREWPWMLPFMNVDLVSAPIHEGPYAMAMTEMEFVTHYRLLDSKGHLKLNTSKATALFSTQLGRLWEGHNRLRKHERALYACFIAQICGGKEGRRECIDGLESLTRSIAAGGFDTTLTDRLMEKYRHEPAVAHIVTRHAYVSTVLCGVLARARERGKIPPSMMGWLMTYDRALWYVFHNLGRKTPFTEGAGVYAHYHTEALAGHKMAYPYVQPAVDGLAHELQKIKLVADVGQHA